MIDILGNLKSTLTSGRVETTTFKTKIKAEITNLEGTSDPDDAKKAIVLKELLKGDTFTKIDLNSDGEISEEELNRAANIDGKPEFTMEDVRALRRSTPAPVTTSTLLSPSSTSPSSSTPTSTTVLPSTPIAQIETYAKDYYRKNKYISNDPTGIQKTILFDPVKLNENQTIKITLGEDQLVHFIIYSDESFSDENLITEYTVPLKTLQRLSLDLEESIFLSLNDRQYEYDKNFAKTDKGAKQVFNISSDSNKSRAFELIKRLFISGNSLNAIQNSDGVQFRQARGIDNLIRAKYGNPTGEIPPPEEYTGSIPELANLYSTLKCSTVFWTGQRKGIGTLVKYNYTSGPKAGKTYYTLAYVPADSTGNPTNQILEYEFEESALKKIAQQDAQNVDFSDVNQVRNWLMTHFRFDSDSLTAYIHRKKGAAQFGEIEGLTVRSENGSSLANAMQKCQNKKREKVVDIEKSFKTGKLNIPEPYKHGVPASVTKFFDLITEYNKLKGYEAPLRLPPIQTGTTTYKQIIINTENIIVINWERINGVFQPVRYLPIKREFLRDSDFDMFTELTPRRLQNNNSQERDYLEGEAQRYFGYATRYPSGSRSINELLDTRNEKLEAEIKDLEKSKRR